MLATGGDCCLSTGYLLSLASSITNAIQVEGDPAFSSTLPHRGFDNSRQCVNSTKNIIDEIHKGKGGEYVSICSDPEREGKVILEFNDCLNRYIYAPSIFKKNNKLIRKLLIRIAIRLSISFPSRTRRRKREGK